MNKAGLIDRVHKSTDLTKKDAESAVNAVFDAMSQAMAEGDKVQIIGFGTFATRKRAARTGRNPATKEEIQIPAATVPVFKPGKALKDMVKDL